MSNCDYMGCFFGHGIMLGKATCRNTSYFFLYKIGRSGDLQHQAPTAEKKGERGLAMQATVTCNPDLDETEQKEGK